MGLGEIRPSFTLPSTPPLPKSNVGWRASARQSGCAAVARPPVRHPTEGSQANSSQCFLRGAFGTVLRAGDTAFG
jgi:hypothetical protein